MNQPPADPSWMDFLQYVVAALVAGLARGAIWQDPKTGIFSLGQLLQSVGTAGTIAYFAAAAQQYWHYPIWITSLVAVVLALVGISFIATAMRVLITAYLRSPMEKQPPK